ncbi:hypothetical protein [Lewinella sp. LCG006]|uniref:hypothetical protein n=1 Tax=Lewinella sp. LCG006 TaxID=3231911 RepID=UPI003460884E
MKLLLAMFILGFAFAIVITWSIGKVLLNIWIRWGLRSVMYHPTVLSEHRDVTTGKQPKNTLAKTLILYTAIVLILLKSVISLLGSLQLGEYENSIGRVRNKDLCQTG